VNFGWCRSSSFLWPQVIVFVAITCLGVPPTRPEIQNLVSVGTLDGMRWPNFRDYQPWLEKFYDSTATLQRGSNRLARLPKPCP
jgi:hypothetical protein